MKASLLVAYLSGKENVAAIRMQIRKSVEIMRKQLNKKGVSIEVKVDADINSFVIINQHVVKLCNDFSANKLDEVEISYITTAMELSDCFYFESEEVEDAISVLSDPVSNGPLTKQTVLDIVSSIQSQSRGQST